ncbi:MAG: NADH-quinone oxidoreductase subunit A [Chloroflexi bacterium]|nr:NADH-quinone oxidoreductase subunit A [Chloroflexota bacterium]MBI3734421.1 NADH-quinone oxidoreductase subunit A [Chloroflexota bacterium]
MLGDYAGVGILLAIALTVPIGGYLIAFLLRPKRPYALKKQTYECGLETAGDTWVQFKIQYYIFALVFVVFDIETVFIYPWAVAYQQVGLFALAEMIVFIGILFMGLAYAWRKGALEWI